MPALTESEHQEIGISLFNRVWELMDLPDRSPAEVDEMIHAAHASSYHWGASHPPAVNLARGEWQISRVYCILQRPESAVWHAQRSLEICLQNNIGDFDLAFGYEAMARAFNVKGDAINTKKYLSLAQQVAATIKDPEDKAVVLQDLSSITNT